MPGTLYVVATPIGNLEDITLRALRVLKEVAVVAAEDTRRTGNLLRHYGIATPLLSVHAHNEKGRIAAVLGRLERGEAVALVTDAGTPAISDPGATLVDAVRTAGFRVEPIPGPSAVVAALSAAGLPWNGFSFLAFPPIRSKDREEWFSRIAREVNLPVVFYEAPHRLLQTLEQLRDKLGERPIILAREVTKMHEEFLRGTPSELLQEARAPRGEYTVIVLPASTTAQTGEAPTDDDIVAMFGQMTTNDGLSKRARARLLANKLGLSTKLVYDALERSKT